MYTFWKESDPDFSWRKILLSGYPPEWWYFFSRVLLRPVALVVFDNAIRRSDHEAPLIAALRAEDRFRAGDKVWAIYSSKTDRKDARLVRGVVPDEGLVETARDGSAVKILLDEPVPIPENLHFLHGEGMRSEIIEVVRSPLLIREDELQYLLDHEEFRVFFAALSSPADEDQLYIAMRRYSNEGHGSC